MPLASKYSVIITFTHCNGKTIIKLQLPSFGPDDRHISFKAITVPDELIGIHIFKKFPDDRAIFLKPLPEGLV